MKQQNASCSPLSDRPKTAKSKRRRGIIFVTVLGVIVILGGLLLSFAVDMRTEAIAAANRAAQIQADAIELAGEQYVMANIDYYNSTAPVLNANGSNVPDSWSLVFNTPAQAVQCGNGYFWIIRPNEQSDQDYDYGIVDECAKLNINGVTPNFSSTEFLQLPTDITQDVADAMTDWNTSASVASQDGAETDYYNGLPIAYECKNQPYETVDELMLVRGIDAGQLYGMDANRDGVVDDNERANGQNVTSSSANGGATSVAADTRGIARYLTVWTQNELPLQAAATKGGGTTAAAKLGLVNVNTASENVLIAMGLTESQANSLQTAAQGQTGGLIQVSDVSTALGGNVSSSFYQQVTTSSYQYSADIVGVSGDGRAFKRVKIVVDCSPTAEAGNTGSSGTVSTGGVASTAAASATPSCVIVYRRDLTSFGWPLPQDIRTALRSGQPIEPGVPGSNLQDNTK